MEQQHKTEIAQILERCSFDKTTKTKLQHPSLSQIKLKQRKRDEDYITELRSILSQPKSPM
jgi:hypothetical protein